MTVYLNQDSFAQPLPPEGQHSGEIQKNLKSQEETEGSDDEVFPERAGFEAADNEEVCNAIREAYKRNQNFQVKLIKYTERKIREIIGGKYDGRLQPDDVVEEAMYRILEGKRKWYKDKVGTIEKLIFMVIISLIRIEAEQIPDIHDKLYNPMETGAAEKEKKIRKPRIIPLYYTPKNESEEKDQGNTIAEIEKYKNADKSEYENDFDFQRLDEAAMISKFEEELEEDENEFFVFQEMIEGNKSNIDIAKKLGIEVKEVENARKRIKRKALKLKNELKNK